MSVLGTAWIRVVGETSLVNNLRRAGDRGMKAAACGLYLVANNLMTRSKRLVPVDLGVLRASGYATLPVGESTAALTVEVGYGGPASGYAEKQHERTDYYHPVGGAKFLSRAIDAYTGMPQDFAKYTTRAFLADKGVTPLPTPTTPAEGKAVPRRRKKK